ncbi:MAG: hypothetical protein ACMUEL_09755 [Flavobacteriales bacterium Tduv]
MMLLSHWYDLIDVGTEELVKESLSYMRFLLLDWKIKSLIMRIYADFEMK